ncbi:MAG: ATP-binding protein [Bacteroidetes bacterium]|nr:ATP-binding protein [Bacteroidota bacterium]
MQWNRLGANALQVLAKAFPAVVVLGARQVGKTTLARETFPQAEYVDLESPLIRARFLEDPAHELARLGRMTILDEAQMVPDLFAALRGEIDRRRKERKCHFCLLGSAQPALIRGVSESLAGRVGILMLEPLSPAETGLSTGQHWLRGGFPEALRGDFRTWWEPYLDTILQRDLAAYGFRPNALFLRRLLGMVASQQGGLLNLSSLGNALGVRYHAVQHGLDLLEGVFLIRRLPPFFRKLRKRLVKAPRIFIRDTGLLHQLLHISSLRQLEAHALRGASWETFVIEDLMRRERLSRPHTQFFFWRTATGQEVDLIMDRGDERLALEIKISSGTNPHDIRQLEARLDDIGAARGFLLGRGAGFRQMSARVWTATLEDDPGWLPD